MILKMKCSFSLNFIKFLVEIIKGSNYIELLFSSRFMNVSSIFHLLQLTTLSDLRSLLDEKALEKEQLNQLCASLCVGSTAQQSSNIRASINDLNIRWNRVSGLDI